MKLVTKYWSLFRKLISSLGGYVRHKAAALREFRRKLFIWDSIMLDLETMGTGPNAVVVQIGAVAFNSLTGRRYSAGAFEIDVDLDSSASAGGVVTEATVNWWEEQGGFKPTGDTVTLAVALLGLSKWSGEYPSASRVWAQGPSFDVAIIDGFVQRVGTSEPWKYNAARDTRTVYDLAKQRGWTKPPGVEPTHRAVEDCDVQITALMSALRCLRGFWRNKLIELLYFLGEPD